jgi:hypothetical protein
MIRYICKTKEEIVYLWNYFNLNKITRDSVDDVISEFTDIKLDMKMFIDKEYFEYCGGNCKNCVYCDEMGYSEEANINIIKREEKLNRILND